MCIKYIAISQLTVPSIVRIFDPVVAIKDHVLLVPTTLNLSMESVQSNSNFANQISREKKEKKSQKKTLRQHRQ